MVHADDPAGARYTFPDGDPPARSGGELAVEPFRYAVSSEEAGGEASGERAEVEAAETLPESGVAPPAALLAVGAVLYYWTPPVSPRWFADVARTEARSAS